MSSSTVTIMLQGGCVAAHVPKLDIPEKIDCNLFEEHLTMAGPVTNKQEFLERLGDIRITLLALGVHRLGLFGSFEKGTQNPTSDIDILVEFKPGSKSFDSFMELAFLLEDVFQREVELVTKESLSPYIGHRILHEVSYVPVPA